MREAGKAARDYMQTGREAVREAARDVGNQMSQNRA
jgi:hypothetical protein